MSQGDARSEVPGGSGPPPRLQSWLESWVRALLELASVSSARRAEVLASIVEGSQPTTIYYVLLGISELIACFALIIDSDATLIGANVVAPLMTPIFGVALGLARGDLRLLRTALIAEFGGAFVGVALCFLLGLLPFALEPTPALLAQTRPTLIDLMVAALAGLAGALAMIDERVSPVLPGVAIATALNPPIAAIGLCLALGAYQGAWGAFLLFFANVLAILGVAGAMFVFAGFVTKSEIGSLRGLARRFAGAGIGLFVVTVVLTRHLVGMVGDLRTERAIKETLDSELAQEPSTALESVEFDRAREGVEVLSTVRTPHVIPPERVKRMQDALSSRLGEPVRLFVRCSLTKDVTATGSTNLRPYLSLNGRVTEAPLAPEMRLLQQAEQVAREVAGTRPEIALLDVDLVHAGTTPVLVVSRADPAQPRARVRRALRSAAARAARGAEPAGRDPAGRLDGHHGQGAHPLRRGALRRRAAGGGGEPHARRGERSWRASRRCRTCSSPRSTPCAPARAGTCARRSSVRACPARRTSTRSRRAPAGVSASPSRSRCARAWT